MLQRGRPAPIWGWQTAGAKVSVSFHGTSHSATAGADGLWKAWSSFVADTMGWWDKSTESIRLALDPLTVKSTFGVSADAFAVDSDVGLIIFLCLVLCGAVVQRWRQG